MLEQDQREVRECSKTYRQSKRGVHTYEVQDNFIVRAQGRVKRVIEILDEIEGPTIANIGGDASQAMSVLALHSRLSVMKEILARFERSYERDHDSVYHEAIPSLTDRILIIEGKKQRFATQWMFGQDNKFFLPPVEDFDHLNKRRAVRGLGKSKHPIDLTDGVPEREPPRPETRASDQRTPTRQEYEDFVYGSLD